MYTSSFVSFQITIITIKVVHENILIILFLENVGTDLSNNEVKLLPNPIPTHLTHDDISVETRLETVYIIKNQTKVNRSVLGMF